MVLLGSDGGAYRRGGRIADRGRGECAAPESGSAPESASASGSTEPAEGSQ
jgi:hypothetical protein